jgi:putative membrane protein
MRTLIAGLAVVSLGLAGPSLAGNPRASGEVSEKGAKPAAGATAAPASTGSGGTGGAAGTAPTAGAKKGDEGPAPSGGGSGLSDPQIATVALTAHQIDIERGKLAQKKAASPEVKQFATQMVTDHGQGQTEVLGLAKKLKVKTEESDVTKALKSEAADKMLLLRGLTGAAFDKAYVDAEVAYHEGVLGAIDQALIPGARNAELKTALQNVRPTIAGHLQHAKGLQTMLAGAK